MQRDGKVQEPTAARIREVILPSIGHHSSSPRDRGAGSNSPQDGRGACFPLILLISLVQENTSLDFAWHLIFFLGLGDFSSSRGWKSCVSVKVKLLRSRCAEIQQRLTVSLDLSCLTGKQQGGCQLGV